MNLEHLRATLWLRWRILRNRVRRGSKMGNALFGALLVLGACVALGLFILAFVGGLQLPADEGTAPVLVSWLGLALGFLFFWTIGLVTDLQRSDAMSFKSLLHLPVSLRWVFFYNYLSSFVSLSVAIFLPAMAGLALAMVVANGPRMLLGLVLVLGFLVMVTALTYQLRGWLARLMENKRQGRNIVAAVTVLFVLLLQVPNLINLGVGRPDRDERRAQRREVRRLELVSEGEGAKADAAREELERLRAASDEADRALERTVTLATQLVPVGWLPYGMLASFQGKLLQGVLCALGMLTIGALSLLRSFRTTLRSVVRGGAAARAGPAAARRASAAAPERGARAKGAPRRPLVERDLPFASERVSGVATATLRGLLRAPEAKLLLLSPVILLVVFGFLFSKPSTRELLGSFGPAVSLGAITLGLLSILQLIQNQFGLDREGFRAFVLSPVPRVELLLGKNLATAPLGLGVGLIALVAIQLLFPADLAHFLGACLQLASAYLVLCLVGNFISILGPMRLREGSLKAMSPKFTTILWQLLSMLAIPLVLSPLAIPSALEFFLGHAVWARRVPLFPLLHAAGLGLIVLFYRWMLGRQGELLQQREQHILDVLTRE